MQICTPRIQIQTQPLCIQINLDESGFKCKIIHYKICKSGVHDSNSKSKSISCSAPRSPVQLLSQFVISSQKVKSGSNLNSDSHFKGLNQNLNLSSQKSLEFAHHCSRHILPSAWVFLIFQHSR